MMTSIASFLAALVVTTFVEYVVHRLMHAGLIRHERHTAHHKDGWGQGVWLELKDYLVPGSVVILPAWLLGTAVGTGWTLGCVASAVFVAYAHQLQHDNPLACRWMRVPVHYVHHRDQMWHHNFGLSNDVWDRLLGTYKHVPFGEEFTPEERGRGAFDIHWRKQDEARAAVRVRACEPRGTARAVAASRAATARASLPRPSDGARGGGWRPRLRFHRQVDRVSPGCTPAGTPVRRRPRAGSAPHPDALLERARLYGLAALLRARHVARTGWRNTVPSLAGAVRRGSFR
jgi:hypothetical protein